MLKSSFFKHFFYKSFGIRKNETIFAVENYHHIITTNLNHTDTNHFRDDLPQYWNMTDVAITTPTDSTMVIVKAADKCLTRLFRTGYHYKRAGVIVMGIMPRRPLQLNMFDDSPAQRSRTAQLNQAIMISPIPMVTA